MTTLTVTAKGQVTLRKEVLQHLGVRPGEQIVLDKLPDGRIEVRAARPSGLLSDVFVPRDEIAQAVRRLIGAAGVIVDRPATEAGLALLEAGGDFADGAIAYEGRWLGADTFVSFDNRAVRIIAAQGHAARLP
jgi:AbrB family looped-hinge helix DNA binding protein